jgi:arylsulfatase
MSALRTLAGITVCALALAACQRPAAAPPIPAATRGYVLISLDALRPDHLGAYGYARATSPFLDSLAARGAVFERALAHYPSTLPSHLTMFTGLYPQEHGAFRPERFLDPAIETLPQRLQARGFRTGGFTEGGFMTGAYGFERGFDQFDDSPYRDDTDVERTFERGLRFLAGLGEEERFFLFLHTYSIHDPYTPPERYRGLFWPGELPPGVFESSGPNLRAVNRGELAVTPEIVAYFASQYDASIRYVDDVLAGFWAGVEELGLADEITLIVTSDHGEAFYEHGKLAHMQVYPEDLRVPLIVVHPGLAEPVRVPALVGLVDLAPSLYELMRVEPPAALSGRSLAPYLTAPDVRLGDEAYGEALDRVNLRTLLREQDDTIYQVVLIEPEIGREGTWITRSVTFQPTTDRLEFETYSFHRPRTVRVLTDGEEVASFEAATEWQPMTVTLPPGPPQREVTLATDDCESPLSLGKSEDARCLSFQLRGMPLRRSELYDLGADPGAGNDISRERPDLHRLLLRRLLDTTFEPVAEGQQRQLSDETVQTLRDLGYLR